MSDTVQSFTLACQGHQVAALRRMDGAGLPPVIFVHGIAASMHFWPAVLGARMNQLDWCSLSLPGHAPSTVPVGFTAEDVTSDLFGSIVCEAAQQWFPGQKPHLVGWSTGGFAILMAAAMESSQFSSLTSISGFARGRWGDLLGMEQRMAGSAFGPWQALSRWSFRQLAENRWLLNAVLRRLTGRTPTISAESLPAWQTLQEAATKNSDAVLATMFAAIRRLDISNELGRISLPVQIIGGTEDRVIPPAETSHLAGSIRSAKHVELQGVGHMFFAEAHEQSVLLIADWIQIHSEI
ncbi:MAG: alpha/beta fold hydrolase [Planctomycetaceae bacterium]|nr:alpha/beta fold hydrolase [Planctomycetaceae bacterium]